MKKFVIWSKIPVGWMTDKAGELTLLRQEAHEFAEGDLHLKNARRSPEAFQIYEVRQPS